MKITRVKRGYVNLTGNGELVLLTESLPATDFSIHALPTIQTERGQRFPPRRFHLGFQNDR